MQFMTFHPGLPYILALEVVSSVTASGLSNVSRRRELLQTWLSGNFLEQKDNFGHFVLKKRQVFGYFWHLNGSFPEGHRKLEALCTQEN